MSGEILPERQHREIDFEPGLILISLSFIASIDEGRHWVAEHCSCLFETECLPFASLYGSLQLAFGNTKQYIKLYS